LQDTKLCSITTTTIVTIINSPTVLKPNYIYNEFKTNIPWGDNLSFQKPASIFRLYYQNVNGIKLDEHGGELRAICQIIKELDCDLCRFCKTKLDTVKYQVRKIVTDTLRKQFQNHHVSMLTSPVPFEGYYKPGGTMSFCVDHNTSRCSDKFQDQLGRWTTLLMVGCNNRLVHFITLYQVVAKESSGPYTAF
jgi:hypothetical protein